MSFKAFLQEKALVKGAFHRWLGKSEDEPITAADIAKGKAAGGHPEKMAVQAQNFRESVDESHSKIEKITAREILDKHQARGTDFHALRFHQVDGLLGDAKKHGYKKNKFGNGSTARMFHAHLHRIIGEGALAPEGKYYFEHNKKTGKYDVKHTHNHTGHVYSSHHHDHQAHREVDIKNDGADPYDKSGHGYQEEVQVSESAVSGTRIVSKHGVGSTHHAEVRYNKDYEEYSVHHYSHGKHLGEGPVSYHGNDKEDAKNTAEHEVKRRNSVSESVSREPHKRGTKVTVGGKRGEISHVQTSDEGEHVYKVTDVDANDPYKQKRLENGNYIPHNRIKVVKEETVNESMPIRGHEYHKKSEAELHYIMKDAHAASKAMQNHDSKAHMKYLDQVNDAATVLHYRRKGGKRVVDEPAAVHAEETITEVKKGDHVHLGFGTKGGAGFRGHVLSVDGNNVHIRSHDAEHGPFGKSHREWKGPLKNVSIERIGEEVMATVNEKITDSKESLEKAIAAAEAKAQKAKSRENSSYIEALKKALRRIKGRKNIRASEVGQKAVAEDTTSAPSEPGTVKRVSRIKFKKKTQESTEKMGTETIITELSKKVLSSYRSKAIGQIKAGKGPLSGKEEKRFNGAAKSVKEAVSEGKTLKPHDARKLFDKYNARAQSDSEAHAATPAGQVERKARNDAMLKSRHEEVSQTELDSLYEADTAFHNQDEFTKHAHASGHVVRTVLRGSNAHIHAKHLGSGKTHGLFDVKKEHGVYSTSPLHVDEQFDGDELVLESEGMSDAAHELVLHADNHAQLHHSSHQPIIKNLKKKAKSGKYDPEKAKKLWGYHADRAAQTYHKEHGSGGKWHHMFSTSDRKQAAAHWEAHHRHEVHE